MSARLVSWTAWNRWLAASLMLWTATESIGVLLTVAVSAAMGAALDPDSVVMLAVAGLGITAIPAMLYSGFVAAVFVNCGWTRRLAATLGFAWMIAGVVFAVGWWFVLRDNVIRGAIRSANLNPPILLAVSLAASAGGVAILHRWAGALKWRQMTSGSGW